MRLPKQYFYTYKTFERLQKIKQANLFHRFYSEKFLFGLGCKAAKKSDNQLEKINEKELEKTKKKYKLNLYSKSRFELKFGENLYRFVANLESMKEGSSEFNEALNKINNSKTLGRRVLFANKKFNC